MEEKSLVVVEQPQNVQTESVLIIEQFLNDNYRLRRNMLAESTAMWLTTKPFRLRLHDGVGVKTGGRREGQPIYPPVPHPSVHRPFGQKREEGRDILKFI